MNYMMSDFDYPFSDYCLVENPVKELYVITKEENEKWIKIKSKYDRNEMIPEDQKIVCYRLFKNKDEKYRIKQPMIETSLKAKELYAPIILGPGWSF